MRSFTVLFAMSTLAACGTNSEVSEPIGELLSGIEMQSVEAGSFQMGSLESDSDRGADEQLHEVSLSQNFEMGLTEVTVDQFRAYMN